MTTLQCNSCKEKGSCFALQAAKHMTSHTKINVCRQFPPETGIKITLHIENCPHYQGEEVGEK